MLGQAKERWLELCEQAAAEQNPQKLMDYVAEIDRLLEEKTRLANAPGISSSGKSPLPKVNP
jgi:hypothetical protein